MKITDFSDERIEAVEAGAPLTAEEREFLVTDTAGFEESWPRKEADYRAMDDATLMRAAYRVWADYASTQG